MTATSTPGAGSGNASSATPYMLAPGEGERLWIVGDVVVVKATAESTRGALTLLEVETPPGSGPPPHYHDREDETFYVLDGTFELLLGDRLVGGGPGTFAFVPRRTVHRFRNVGDRNGRILIQFAPAGLEGFFREAGSRATHDGPAPPLDAAEIARTNVAGERYGLHVVDWRERTDARPGFE